MALVACDSCQHRISDLAQRCPKCGHPRVSPEAVNNPPVADNSAAGPGPPEIVLPEKQTPWAIEAIEEFGGCAGKVVEGVIGLGLFILLVVSWAGGTFDKALVNVGLNAKPCIRNVFGATFCGDEAKQYCQNLTNAGLPTQGTGCDLIR